MGYKKYLDEQKKYIEAKKEALFWKEEKERNPREPKLDPPPVPVSKLSLFLIFFSLSLFSLFLIWYLIPPLPASLDQDHLVVAIIASDEEYFTIKNWLAPELLANNLAWDITHYLTLAEVFQESNQGHSPHFLILEDSLAFELFQLGLAASLRENEKSINFTNFYYPLYEAKPFQKNFGLVIPSSDYQGEARHLYIVLKQFAPRFSLP